MSTKGTTITIAGDVARRFLLGRQGLWPGRRWRGRDGTLDAVRQLGAVQMDPLTIVARSHDLVLWNRVTGYRPEWLRQHLYDDRSLFDYGGVLRIQPIEELPHWRLHMERRREDAKYYLPLRRDHPDLFDAVRSVIEREGPLSSREVAKLVEATADPGSTTPAVKTGSYRSGSIVGRVAYQLWMTGELMTHHREGFERHFDLSERVAPAGLLVASDEATARDFFAGKVLARSGLISPGSWRSAMAHALMRRIDRAEGTAWVDRLIACGKAITVRVDGHRGHYLAPGNATTQLQELVDGSVPAEWKSGKASAEPAVRLLSPLDPIARDRARAFFGFEHIWEIYKPAEKRRWGPFTMPLLYGDGLVGRVDPRMDRETGTLHLNGIWLESPDLAGDPAFATALTSSIRDLATFLNAERIELHHCEPEMLRSGLEALDQG